MNNPPLDEALKTYEIALDNLEDSASPMSEEQIIAVLNARDFVQAAGQAQVYPSYHQQKKLVALDVRLKQNAWQISKVIDFASWRTSLEPRDTAWWWHLETEAELARWQWWDWLWRGLSIAGWTANLGLLIDLLPRFLIAGTGFAGAVAIAFPSLLTVLQAISELTETGKEGFDKLLIRLGIPKHFHAEAQLGATELLLLILLGFNFYLPNFSNFSNRRGFENYNKGQLASAEAHYQQALALNPDNVKAHYNLALVYEDLQQFDKARTQYQFAVKGGFVKAYNNLGRLHILNNKPSLAIPLLLKGLAKAEQASIKVKYDLMKNLGWARLKQQRWYEAEKFLLGAVSIGSSQEGSKRISNRGSAHCLLAQVYQGQNQKTKALNQWQKCCQFGSSANPDEDLWLGLAHKKLKEDNQSCGQNNRKP
ncbi:tetratricopeptide repeat protein [Moorena producens JHB]|uniref:Tetratricopeptide repeat protein n=1 Tax=Moorena producens (strain JHB) TaxID=1454205 RepID=A0A1D9FZ21_MOOP1|nr:tetratricopeptide repeat protein [Moorena producens]AOY80628.1 tetratricopeptide repeat protein [Moorena producens JHB]